MNLHRITLCLFFFSVTAVFWTCSKSNQLAATMVYDAKAQISAAKQEDAAFLASDQLTEAENDIAKAEDALKEDSQKAYLMAKRAYLKAQYAEILANMNKAERMADVEETALDKILHEAEAARRDREAAEQELNNLIGTK